MHSTYSILPEQNPYLYYYIESKNTRYIHNITSECILHTNPLHQNAFYIRTHYMKLERDPYTYYYISPNNAHNTLNITQECILHTNPLHTTSYPIETLIHCTIYD